MKKQVQELNTQNQKQFFQSIPLNKRYQYLKEAFNKKQIQGSFKPYHTQYQKIQTWNYKNFQYKYHINETTKKPKAIVIFIHGLNSHGGTSGYLAKIISQSLGNEINMAALDMKNYGRSKGTEKDYGFWNNFDSLAQEVQQFSHFIHQKYETNPKIFLSGLSMGGLVAFKVGLNNKYNYAGCIFIAPALRDHPCDAPILKKFACLALIWQRLPSGQADLSKDTKFNLIDYIKSDPYIISDRQLPGIVGYGILKAMGQANKNFSEFNLPYIVFQPGVDKYVDLFAPLDLQKQSKSKDKTTIYYKQSWHSIQYEPQYHDLSERTVKWLKQRIN